MLNIRHQITARLSQRTHIPEGFPCRHLRSRCATSGGCQEHVQHAGRLCYLIGDRVVAGFDGAAEPPPDAGNLAHEEQASLDERALERR